MARSLTLALVAAVLVLTGCTSPEDPVTDPEAVRNVTWENLTLPFPPGADGRIAVRDATYCDGRWYLVGGVFPPVGDSRPAGWTSADGTTWVSLEFDPVGYWAERAVLSSVGCLDGDVAMVGAKSGGAHGNPRVTTWHRRKDGVFVDVVAPFELYGGPRATSVGRLAAGPQGWMISGNRSGGPAVWLSEDATEFRIVEDRPPLADDHGYDALATDHVWDGQGWTVVGGSVVPGRMLRAPMAWTSPDGEAWERVEVPAADGFTTLDRVVVLGDDVLAAGVREDAFGVWSRHDGEWSMGPEFGAVDPEGGAAAFVHGMAVLDDLVFATVSNGTTYQLWMGPEGESWKEVGIPFEPRAAGDQVLNVVSNGTEVLLLVDDADVGRIYRLADES